VIPVEEARAAARSQDLDLVEIAPDVRPPVCKIMDYGKFRFDRSKKAKEAKQRQSQIEIKEVKLRPNIGDHDLETKLNRARQFLESGNHVRITIMFRAREMRRPENGYRLLERAQEILDDSAQVAQAPPPTLQSRDLSMVLKPA
jgi:translation initiation factor IF-3